MYREIFHKKLLITFYCQPLNFLPHTLYPNGKCHGKEKEKLCNNNYSQDVFSYDVNTFLNIKIKESKKEKRKQRESKLFVEINFKGKCFDPKPLRMFG